MSVTEGSISPPSLGALDDPRVVGPLREYLDALEAGGRPDRATFLARYPDIAEALSECLEGLDFVHEMAGSGECGRPNAEGGEPHSALHEPHSALEGNLPLGDFRLIREVGRGGMGVVYEAEQLSLGRRVALKVLPFASALDGKQLQRFENEAKAAAALHHTNIVPVFATGCERGVHYYAMQFIEGRTLAAIIDELRTGAATADHQPSKASAVSPALAAAPATTPMANALTQRSVRSPLHFQFAAQVGQQAAAGLEHAHQFGVVHRDVKPANLLVDERRNLWVTDFGLAHCQAQAGLTVSGDLLGTLRYMSPEQALSQHAIIDQRTDIYSLGVTLYELLTLEPAFPSRDRHELLRQIAADEPRGPRRLNAAIPAELETIVLKAMAKSPAERYFSANELAEDLGRFLRDEPIRAKRPTLMQVARKWSRRHRPVVATFAVVLLTALIGAVIMGYWYERGLSETERAVSSALAQAATFLDEGDKQTDHPDRWQASVQLAKSALEKADELLAAGAGTDELADRVRSIRAAVDTAARDSRVLVEIERIRLEQASMEIRSGRYDKARAAPLYAKLLRDYGLNTTEREPTAARVKSSRLRETLIAALADWRRITRDDVERQRLEDVLAAIEPPNAFRARWRAAARQRNASLLLAMTQELELQEFAPAVVVDLTLDLRELKEWDAAERVLRAAQQRHPGDFWLNHDLGRALLLAHPFARAEEAIGFLRVALALRTESAVVHHNLAVALHFKRDFDGAIRAYQSALRIEPNYADAHRHLGHAYGEKGELPKANSEYDAAVRLYTEAIQTNSNDADARYSLGEVLWEKRDLDAALQAFQAALRIEPNHAGAHNYVGLFLQNRGRLDDAVAEFQQAVRLEPTNTTARNHLAGALFDKRELDAAIREWRSAIGVDPKHALLYANLGFALTAKGKRDDAIAVLREGIRIDPQAAAVREKLALALYGQQDLAGAIREWSAALEIRPNDPQLHNNLGAAFAETGDLESACREYEQAVRLDPKAVLPRHNLAWVLATAPNSTLRDPHRAVELATQATELARKDANAWRALGVAQYRVGDYGAAVAALEESLQVRTGDDGTTWFILAMAHWRLGHKEEARKWFDQAVTWMDKNRPNDEGLRRFRTEAASVLMPEK